MNRLFQRISLVAIFATFISGCQTVEPYDYTAFKKSKPRSIVIIPPNNNSIEVNAPYIYLSTLTRPLAEKGYYVLPVAVIDRFLKENGLPTPAEMNNISLDKIDKLEEKITLDWGLETTHGKQQIPCYEFDGFYYAILKKMV
jgi:hypothetical protein